MTKWLLKHLFPIRFAVKRRVLIGYDEGKPGGDYSAVAEIDAKGNVKVRTFLP